VPWPPQLVALTGVLVAVGVVLFVVGASRVNNEVVYDNQVPGLNLAVLGAVLASAAVASLLLSGRRAVSGRRVAVLGALPQIARRLPEDATAHVAAEVLVASDDLRHFHRGSCALAADRDWTARSRREHQQAGRTPCGVCRP
jgi:hypothetical protein